MLAIECWREAEAGSEGGFDSGAAAGPGDCGD
jgi:hypothetical protein